MQCFYCMRKQGEAGLLAVLSQRSQSVAEAALEPASSSAVESFRTKAH